MPRLAKRPNQPRQARHWASAPSKTTRQRRRARHAGAAKCLGAMSLGWCALWAPAPFLYMQHAGDARHMVSRGYLYPQAGNLLLGCSPCGAGRRTECGALVGSTMIELGLLSAETTPGFMDTGGLRDAAERALYDPVFFSPADKTYYAALACHHHVWCRILLMVGWPILFCGGVQNPNASLDVRHT